MSIRNPIWLGAGVLIGTAATFYQVDTPRADKCETYKVASKPVTAYVLKPPPAEVRYEACPQTTTKVCPVAEPVSEPIETKAEVDKPETNRPKHRRHRRYRRYWR